MEVLKVLPETQPKNPVMTCTSRISVVQPAKFGVIIFGLHDDTSQDFLSKLK